MKNKKTVNKFFSILNNKKIKEEIKVEEPQDYIDVSSPIITVSFFDDVNKKDIYNQCVDLSRKNHAHINIYYGPINVIINFLTSYSDFILALDNRLKMYDIANRKAQNDFDINTKINAKRDEYDKEKKDERSLKSAMALELTKSFMMMKSYSNMSGNSTSGNIIEDFDEERAVAISCKMSNLIYEHFPVFRKEEI